MSDIVSILEDFTKAPSEKVPLTLSPYRFAGDNHYWAHVFGQHRHGEFFDFSHVGESNQFEIFLRDRSAQRPKVGGIVVLHVHEITDVGILRMIVNPSLQREVAVRFQVLETLAERGLGAGQVIERPEMKNDIELAGTAEFFGAAHVEFARRTRQAGQKPSGLHIAWGWSRRNPGGTRAFFVLSSRIGQSIITSTSQRGDMRLLLQSPSERENFTVQHKHFLPLYTVLTTNEPA